MRRKHKYADGGKVVKDHSAPAKKTPDPKMLGTGLARKAADALKNTRQKQMEDLGI